MILVSEWNKYNIRNAMRQLKCPYHLTDNFPEAFKWSGSLPSWKTKKKNVKKLNGGIGVKARKFQVEKDVKIKAHKFYKWTCSRNPQTSFFYVHFIDDVDTVFIHFWIWWIYWLINRISPYYSTADTMFLTEKEVLQQNTLQHIVKQNRKIKL